MIQSKVEVNDDDESTMDDYLEKFTHAMKALKMAQRTASALWDEMEDSLPVEELERCIALAGATDEHGR